VESLSCQAIPYVYFSLLHEWISLTILSSAGEIGSDEDDEADEGPLEVKPKLTRDEDGYAILPAWEDRPKALGEQKGMIREYMTTSYRKFFL
jgi:hypothetical protein